MKKLMIAALAALTLAGCGDNTPTYDSLIRSEEGGSAEPAVPDTEWKNHGVGWVGCAFTKVVTIESHKYVILKSADGCAIVHAASCPKCFAQ